MGIMSEMEVIMLEYILCYKNRGNKKELRKLGGCLFEMNHRNAYLKAEINGFREKLKEIREDFIKELMDAKIGKKKASALEHIIDRIDILLIDLDEKRE